MPRRLPIVLIVPLLLALLAPLTAAVGGNGPAAEHHAAGLKAADRGDLDAALDRLEAAVRAEPGNLRYGADFRQAAIEAKAYDRSIALFEELAEEHPDTPATLLNWGYAYVDKIPDAGSVTQVILANTALNHFTRALEVEETWLALYTRGNSYVYWPAIFGRTELAIADLERAVEMSEKKGGAAPLYHARAYAALGDAHWRLKDIDTARAVWRRGAARFPNDPDLAARLSREGEALDSYLEAHYALGKRVETHLRELWDEDPE